MKHLLNVSLFKTEADSPSARVRCISRGRVKSNRALWAASFTAAASQPSSAAIAACVSSMVPAARFRLRGTMHNIGRLRNDSRERLGTRERRLGPTPPITDVKPSGIQRRRKYCSEYLVFSRKRELEGVD